MTKKIMGHNEIEKHFKNVKAGVFSRKGSGMMSLSPDLGASEEFLEAETVLGALKQVREAGGAITVVRKRGLSEQEFKNAVAEKIRLFGAMAPEGTPAHRLVAFVP